MADKNYLLKYKTQKPNWEATMGLFKKIHRKMEKAKYDKELEMKNSQKMAQLTETLEEEGFQALSDSDVSFVARMHYVKKEYAECISCYDELERRKYRESSWQDDAVAMYFYGNGGISKDSKKAAQYMLDIIENSKDFFRIQRLGAEVFLGVPCARFSKKDSKADNFELFAFKKEEFERIIEKNKAYFCERMRQTCHAQLVMPEYEFDAISDFLVAYEAYKDLVKLGIWECKRDVKSVEAMLKKEMENGNYAAAYWLSVLYDSGAVEKGESEILNIMLKAYNGQYIPVVYRMSRNYNRMSQYFKYEDRAKVESVVNQAKSRIINHFKNK